MPIKKVISFPKSHPTRC